MSPGGRLIMKQISYIVFFILFAFFGKAQETTVIVEGKVSYVSSRNVYVKFVTTKNIEIGDTLFLKRNDQLVAALEVHSKSSTSTVCNSLLEEKRKLKDEIFARVPVEVEKPKKKKEKKNIERESEKSIEEEIREDEVVTPEVGSEEKPEEEDPQFKEKIKGRISAAGYSSFNDYKDSYRMRYAFSFRGSHLNNSRFSVENYITFRNTRGEWDEVKENLARALKVYSLAAR